MSQAYSNIYDDFMLQRSPVNKIRMFNAAKKTARKWPQSW